MSDFDFGGAFRPQVPDLPPPPSEAEMTLARLELLIRELGETLSRAPQPDIHVAAPDLTEMVNAVVGIKGPATAEEIAEALARRLKFPEPQGSDPVLAELADTLKTLDFRLKGAFGGAATSGAIPGDVARDSTLQQVRDRTEWPLPVGQVAEVRDVSDRVERLLGRVTVDNPTETGLAKDSTLEATHATLSTRATEATLASVLAAVDTLEALTTDVRTEARRRPVYSIESAAATIAANAFGTLYTITPATDIVVTGYNADLNGTSTFNYRMRLITGSDASPVIATMEQVSTSQNSWTPSVLSVPAGTRVAVQVLHGEVTPQEFRASLAFYKEP